MKKINVVLPVYNEESVIGEFTNVLWQTLDALKDRYAFEVIYVLDRSSDRSREIIENICRERAGSQLIVLSKRFGHQMSLVAGLDHCDGDAIIMMDSDLQHPPRVIPELLAEFEKGVDVVHTIRARTEKIGVVRRALGSAFYRMLQSISEVEITESAADFRLISRKVADVFRKSIREHNQFLRGLFHWVGFEQTYVTFVAEERRAGRSKYSLRWLYKFAMSGIVSFSRVPLKVASGIGFFVSIVSLLCGLEIIVEYFITREFPPGWATLAVGLAFFVGLQFVFLGVLGEYVGAIFDEVKNRPIYIVDRHFKSRQ